MTKQSRQPDTVWTMSIPEAGRKYFGIGERSSYRAAASGLLPTIKVGGKTRVVILLLEQQLGTPKNSTP